MKPNLSQVRWLKKHLPKGAKPHDMVPRACCIAKPALGCAIFVTPPQDVTNRKLVGDGEEYHPAATLSMAAKLGEISAGSWVTLVFCSYKDRGCWWEWTPMISFETFRRKT
jgi:hypothetical protein